MTQTGAPLPGEQHECFRTVAMATQMNHNSLIARLHPSIFEILQMNRKTVRPADEDVRPSRPIRRPGMQHIQLDLLFHKTQRRNAGDWREFPLSADSLFTSLNSDLSLWEDFPSSSRSGSDHQAH